MGGNWCQRAAFHMNGGGGGGGGAAAPYAGSGAEVNISLSLTDTSFPICIELIHKAIHARSCFQIYMYPI